MVETEDQLIGIYTEEVEVDYTGFSRIHEIIYGTLQVDNQIKFIEVLRREKQSLRETNPKLLLTKVRVELAKRDLLPYYKSQHLTKTKTTVDDLLLDNTL